MKKLILILLPLMLLFGCNKQDSVIYSGVEAGTIQAGVFTSDNFTKMNVVGNDGKFDVGTERRVLISFRTHPITESNRIDINLLGLWESTSLVPASVGTHPDGPDGSPLEVADAWFAMGFLNILASYTGSDESLHALSATYTASESDITIRLHHDGSQDTAAGGKAVELFLCIPMYDPLVSYDQHAIAAGKKQGVYPAPVLLQWTSHTIDGGPLTLFERKGSYTPPVSGN